MLPAGTTIAPLGAVAGPLSSEAVPQILAGGALGHDPVGAGSVVVEGVGDTVDGVGAAVVVVGGATVGVGSLVVVDVAAGSVGEALSVGEAVSAGVGEAVSVGVGEAVGVVGTPLLAIVKFARRREVVPSDQVSTTLMVCDPSASLLVSYGRAVPSAAVPARSKGAAFSVRTGVFLCHEPSR